MEYKIESWKISELLELITKNRVDLSPPYQRNFIWSPKDQQLLVDSILLGYPIPSFFLFKKEDGNYEMVDGQQRSRTILKFWNGSISNSEKQTIKDIPTESFSNYNLGLIIISNLTKNDSLEKFYALVNKSGKHLNMPELFKAQYHDKLYLALVEELLDNQDFIELDLFTDASTKRMNDRSYLEELVVYLKFGITDKKDSVERLYESDISKEEYNIYKSQFENVINRIFNLNKRFPIKKTRYKQKNDFYTLFNFVFENEDISQNILEKQYDVLIALQEFISPSNDDCSVLKEYALNCVSQSNSKKARINRLQFFNKILLNKNPDGNSIINIILDFFDEVKEDSVKLVEHGGYYLFSVESINKILENAK